MDEGLGYGENMDIYENEREKILRAIEEQMRNLKRGKAKFSIIEEDFEKYHQISKTNHGTFGLESSLPQMNVLTPIKVTLKDGHIPCRSVGRHMASQEEDEFIQKRLADLCRMGIVAPSKKHIYGCTGFTVPKKGPKKYRLVINLKPLNEIIVPTATEMLNLEQQ